MILCAPPLLAVTIYMSPRRIVRSLTSDDPDEQKYYSMIHPRLLTKLFVIIDIACFVTQAAGAIMSGSERPNEAKQGVTIILTGLILQIVALFIFSLNNIFLQVRMRLRPSMLVLSTTSTGKKGLPWNRFIIALHVACCLMIIRNIVHVVEYQSPKDGGRPSLASSEALFYALDASFMLAITIIMIVIHPARLLRMARLARAGSNNRRILMRDSWENLEMESVHGAAGDGNGWGSK